MSDVEMKKAGIRKFKAKHHKGSTFHKPEVYQIESPIKIEKGETVEILMDCKEGFTLFIPKKHFFEKQVIEADDDESRGKGQKETEFKWWGVTLTRTQLDNPNKDNKEMAYCIYTKDLDNFVEGNSPPKMVFDP